jgi:hypothetical protein
MYEPKIIVSKTEYLREARRIGGLRRIARFYRRRYTGYRLAYYVYRREKYWITAQRYREKWDRVKKELADEIERFNRKVVMPYWRLDLMRQIREIQKPGMRTPKFMIEERCYVFTRKPEEYNVMQFEEELNLIEFVMSWIAGRRHDVWCNSVYYHAVDFSREHSVVGFEELAVDEYTVSAVETDRFCYYVEITKGTGEVKVYRDSEVKRWIQYFRVSFMEWCKMMWERLSEEERSRLREQNIFSHVDLYNYYVNFIRRTNIYGWRTVRAPWRLRL